ncbi:MAG: branched-chain amino acid ABC transporter permease [Candidatus Rokubacteria bacterium]|nr:branched-chain amino acid ABC transporter permease [Candidatus Rokubacteria bacterium]
MTFTDQLLQFVLSGVMVGSIYALIALGFTMVFNATEAINFAQGEFVMLGGMSAVAFYGARVPLPLACLLAVLLVTAVGLLFERFTLAPLKRVSVMNLIIITIGGSIFLKGSAMLTWGKDAASLPSFSGDTPIRVLGATLLPQAIWILGTSLVVVAAVRLFFDHAAVGKAMRAVAANRFAATLMGIDVKLMVACSFALSAAVGAVAGIIITPVALTAFDRGTILGLKGFSAAILGGIGSGPGAVLGGLLLGVLEAMGAGFVSSGYKDAIAFLLLILMLLIRPQGLCGARGSRKA